MRNSFANSGNGLNVLLFSNDIYKSLIGRIELQGVVGISSIEVVSSIDEGVKLASLKKFDLLLFEYEYPDTYALSLFLKFQEYKINIPTVVVSNKNQIKQTLLDVSPRNIDYIVKNEEYPRSLTPIIRRLIELNRKKYPKKMSRGSLSDNQLFETRSPLLSREREINNSLTTIIGATQLLLNGDYVLEPRVREKISIIEESAKRIIGRVEKTEGSPEDHISGASPGASISNPDRATESRIRFSAIPANKTLEF